MKQLKNIPYTCSRKKEQQKKKNANCMSADLQSALFALEWHLELPDVKTLDSVSKHLFSL